MHITRNSIATAIAIATSLSTITFYHGEATAVNLTSERITVDFDENVGVGSNPLTGGPKLDNLWSEYGLKMDSSKKELWL